MNSNRIIVEKVINGGYGLGRLADGRIVLLPKSLPGEDLSFTVTHSRKNTLFGQVIHIHRAHPARREPPCPYYDKCGGCDLQHCEYLQQLQLKDGILHDIFFKLNKNLRKTIVPSPEEFGYRQRIRLQVQGTQLGFHQFRSKKLAPIEQCLLAQPLINQTLKRIKTIPEFSKIAETCSEIELLHNPADQLVDVIFHTSRKIRPSDRKHALSLTKTCPEIQRIFFSGANFATEGPYTISCHGNETVHGESETKRLSFLQSFFQCPFQPHPPRRLRRHGTLRRPARSALPQKIRPGYRPSYLSSLRARPGAHGQYGSGTPSVASISISRLSIRSASFGRV